MNRFKALLLGGAICAGVASAAIAQPAMPPHGMGMGERHGPHGRPGEVFGNVDPAQLPEMKGKVAQYLLNPRGDVDGLLLDDGTEIHVPPHLATALVFAVRPGDQVSVRGLKARNASMVMAVTVTNTSTGVVAGTGAHPGAADATGKVKAALHSPHGDIDGVLLEDGTQLRLPPPEATRLAAMLAPGQSVVAQGFGVSGPFGKVVMVRKIGATADSLTEVKMPHMGDHHWKRPEPPKP